MQDDGDHRRFQGGRALDGKVDWGWGFGFDPIAKAAQRAICFQRHADGGYQGIEDNSTFIRRLDDHLQFGAVLVLVAQRRQCDLWLTRLAIS